MSSAKRIFVVEDEPILAMALEDMLEALGYATAGSASSLGEALAAADDIDADAAILDVNLNGTVSFPVADVLARRNIPHLYATGYGQAAAEAGAKDAMILHKPYGLDDLDGALKELLGPSAAA
jgi:DNA-binding response OmpR family regulator